ncbi:Glycosyltransferase involved in cell wall bisynthesis [Marinococcus luteus]|uniref:Glycosyltransferase involved in cell wall bisynthesis n=1 Tax=Marinococcus luteus TaxID=1122204 RepID=A0A1H2THT0_9BACI|nr:glycosyltransferase family 4 protein [Marinococcus luteus]SDW42834.1 Glycosyltransferase involved in cell wall bisynthesis [Marinococcus luteus]
MKLLFVHNIRLKSDKVGNSYTHSSYNKKIWNRYHSIADELSVIVRKDRNLYTKAEAQKYFEIFDKDKINSIEVTDHTASLKSFINPIKRIQKNYRIKKAVQSHDCLIARLPSEYGYTAIKYAKKYNKPYLVEVVACGWDSLWNYNIKGKILAPINFLKQKKHVKNAQLVVYVTNNFLQKRYPTKGDNISCSNVALHSISDEVLQERISKIERTTDKMILGTTAAVDVKYKGQEYIIKALGELKKQGYTKYEYQLVGAGDQQYLEKIAKENDVLNQVVFLGPMKHQEVFEWLDKIDIYAQPSRQEGLPRALIEAMSRALPALGANTAGIPELIDNNFIFSNTNKNINEICSILLKTSKNELIEQAKINFNTSKEYEEGIIERRRQEFFQKLKNQTL